MRRSRQARPYLRSQRRSGEEPLPHSRGSPEAIGDDKIRVNSSSLDHPLTILPDQGIEIVAIDKTVMAGRPAYWLNHDPSGLVEAGYGRSTK
jgi:hypothetical protein